MKISAIIPAAGSGARMGSDIKKPYLKIGSKPILAHTLQVFEKSFLMDDIFVVVSAEDIKHCKDEVINPYNFHKVADVLAGGKTRQASVFNGLQRTSDDTDIIIVHDGVRPFITEKIIEASVESAYQWGAAVVAVPVKDTIKVADNDNFVSSTPDRSQLWAIQTPQVFRREILIKAHLYAQEQNIDATDDAALVEKLGYKVKLVMGSYRNIKITTPEDLVIAEALETRFLRENGFLTQGENQR
ncbi:2-C-methyl-D-erythritol 4-phosphate cytidylyltransferase [Candidatus Poribacteria bacterium]|nr:2-C-methyl-D-erythritol 4-phosphate cytidylyltransferase [Candidatus Poribacteria bacterium]